jgi:hypothetical protein
METTLVSVELHVTEPVMFWVVPSLYVPIAWYTSVEAGARTAWEGVTAIDVSVAPLTVKGAVPVTLPSVAPMFAVPALTPVTRPPDVLTVAAALSELHVTSDVRVCVLLSLNFPVALNASFVPGAIDLPKGVTVIETTVAFVTVSDTVGVKEPNVAVIVVGPAASPFAMPFEGPIVALVVSEDVHADWVVRLRVPPSLKVPVAVSFRLVPWAIVGFTGVIVSEVKFAAFTVNDALPLTAPDVAVIMVVPRFTPVATPLTVIDAVLGLEEVHVTVLVMSWVVLSEKVPSAVYCCWTPNGIVLLGAVTAIEVTVALETVKVAVPEMEPEVAVMVAVPAPTPSATPLVGNTPLINATADEDDVHVTLLVRFCVAPSAYVPVAVNDVFVVAAIWTFAGATVIIVKGAGTVTKADPLIVPEVAVIVVVPNFTAVANPPALMVAVAGVEELHVTELVKSCVGPLE